MKFKRIMAVALAAMTIAGTSVMALPVSAASSSTSATSAKATSTKYDDSTYKTKLNKAKQTTAYKKVKTNMQRVAIIAESQANLTFSSFEKASKAYGISNVEWCGTFVKWCLRQGGYTPLKSGITADPESIGVPASKTVLTYYGTKRLSDNMCFSRSYVKGIKASNKNIATAKINYKKGGILCFGSTYSPIDASKKLYYFGHCGIITNVSTYGDAKVIGYVCGNEINGKETVYHTFTINTKTGKVSGLKDRIIMSYSEY